MKHLSHIDKNFRQIAIAAILLFMLTGNAFTQSSCQITGINPGYLEFTSDGGTKYFNIAYQFTSNCGEIAFSSVPEWLEIVKDNDKRYKVTCLENKGDARLASIDIRFRNAGTPIGFIIYQVEWTPPPPKVIVMPAELYPGQKATIKVDLANASSYQWMMSTDGGNTFVLIKEATGKEYSFIVNPEMNNSQIYCNLSNEHGFFKSETITVNLANQAKK